MEVIVLVRVYLCKDIAGRHFFSVEEPAEDSNTEIIHILENVPGEVFAVLDRMVEVTPSSKLPKRW